MVSTNSLILINIFLLLILTIVFYLYYPLCKYYLMKNKTDISPRIIVSMTTSPKRIYHLKDTIDSIMNQTVEVDYIHINLPKVFKRDNTKFTKIPNFLLENKKVILNVCEDIGPATKIVPTIKSDFIVHSDIILSIDDDIYYPNNLVETYLYYHCMYSDCVLTGTSLFYKDETKGKYKDSLVECELLEGFSCVLYKKKHLEDIPLDIFDKTKVPIYHYLADDLVLSNYVLKKNYKILALTRDDPTVAKINPYDYGLKNDALHKGAAGSAGCKIDDDCNRVNYYKTMEYLKQRGEYYLSRTF